MKWISLLCGWAGVMIQTGCTPLQGGWDVAALSKEIPELEEIEGHRLGDLIPYPALIGEELVFVACRFAPGARVRLSGAGVGWSPDSAAIAVDALDRSLPAIDLELEPDSLGGRRAPQARADDRSGIQVLETSSASRADEGTADAPQIEIVSVLGGGASSPAGLGDTLAECDVHEDGSGRIQGWLMRAEIRIRRARPAGFGPVQQATEEEWIAALLHEIGHALGFSSHVARRGSLMSIDSLGLRRAARHAIEGEPLPTADLEALYRVEPGRVLGRPNVSKRTQQWIREVLRTVESESLTRGTPAGPIAIVGDDAARLVWRWSDSEVGTRSVAIHFPLYRRQLIEGAPLRGIGVATRGDSAAD